MNCPHKEVCKHVSGGVCRKYCDVFNKAIFDNLESDKEKRDVIETKYSEGLDDYLKNGIGWDAIKNPIIQCDHGDVEQFASDSFFHGFEFAKKLFK